MKSFHVLAVLASSLFAVSGLSSAFAGSWKLACTNSDGSIAFNAGNSTNTIAFTYFAVDNSNDQTGHTAFEGAAVAVQDMDHNSQNPAVNVNWKSEVQDVLRSTKTVCGREITNAVYRRKALLSKTDGSVFRLGTLGDKVSSIESDFLCEENIVTSSGGARCN